MVIGANAIWAADSLIVLAAGWLDPSTGGAVWIALQALVVADFAGLQAAALRERAPLSSGAGPVDQAARPRCAAHFRQRLPEMCGASSWARRLLVRRRRSMQEPIHPATAA